jgi:dihydroxyacetone kinase-like protein
VSWNADDVASVVQVMANTLVERETYFCELDSVVGDGDFGFSLARGFEVVQAEIDAFDRSSPAAVLRRVAMALASKSGGTTGPIWGTAFLRAAKAAGDRTQLEPEDVVAMLRAGVAGIAERGGAEMGDKTLLDALVPAIDVLDEAVREGVAHGADPLGRAAGVAAAAAEESRNLVARRGRAAYTGERSVGALDPGAVAVAVLFQAIHAAWPRPPDEEGT